MQNLEEQTANIRSMEQLAAQKEQEHLHSKTAQVHEWKDRHERPISISNSPSPTLHLHVVVCVS